MEELHNEDDSESNERSSETLSHTYLIDQQNGETSTEVGQFKANQQLLNPNQANKILKDDIEFINSSTVFSENEEEIIQNFCTELCCQREPSTPENEHSEIEQNADEFFFEFSLHDDICSTLEKHDAYLIGLKNSDHRLEPVTPRSLVSQPCSCGKRCDSLLSIVEICYYRLSWAVNYHDRTASQFFFIKLMMIGKNFIPRLKSHVVCVPYFANVNIIPVQRIHRFVNLINGGICQPVHPNSGKHFEHQSTIDKLVKLATFIDENFDLDPSQKGYMATSKWDKTAAAGEAFDIPCEKRRNYNFTKFFNKLTVKTRFHSGNELTKCSICSEYSFQSHRKDLQPDEKSKIAQEWDKHKETMKNRRRGYVHRGSLGREQPTKFLSATLDGMCKTKLRLPKLNDQRSKKVDDNDKIYCNLNLCLIHKKEGNHVSKSVAFFSPGGCYDSTTNAIVSQLLFGISTCDIIPPTIFIQVDNFPANKSYVFFAAFGYFLKCQKTIREFYISFMVPGHTHCDVDAKFGNFSTFLKKRQCGSPEELIAAFIECIHGEAHMLQTIYNFKDQLHPHCINYGKIKSMYDFHIFLDENGIPMIENAGFQLSENLLCGTRQKNDSFISKIFKETLPEELKFPIVPPKLEALEKLPKLVPKWKDVISTAAKEDLLSLKNKIEAFKGMPFTSLLEKIESKAVTLIQEQNVIVSETNTVRNERDSVFEDTTNTAPAPEPEPSASNVINRRSTRIHAQKTKLSPLIRNPKKKRT